MGLNDAILIPIPVSSGGGQFWVLMGRYIIAPRKVKKGTKGQTWVARQVRKLPKTGVAAPSTLPLDPPLNL